MESFSNASTASSMPKRNDERERPCISPVDSFCSTSDLHKVAHEAEGDSTVSAIRAIPLSCTRTGSGGIDCSSKSIISPQSALVWLHLYDVDALTGWLNWAFLRRADMGVFHAGVEVFGDEYSFQFFEDSWEDCAVSGLQQCQPKSSPDFIYRESFCLGSTPLAEFEVAEVLLMMHHEWPANSYHLTRNNCIHFAKALVERLQTPEPFPEWILGIVSASAKSPTIDGVLDYGWSVSKWWMIQKHNPSPSNNWLCGDPNQICGNGSSGHHDGGIVEEPDMRIANMEGAVAYEYQGSAAV